MAYEHKPGTGSLFPNDKKKDTQPDYRGTVNIDGKFYEVAGWKKQSAKGTYLSLSVKPKEAKATDSPRNDLDDEIPF